MANSLTTNPMTFDTAGATSAVTTNVNIRKILWSGIGTNADDIALHTKASGEAIFTGKALANTTLELDFGDKGFSVPGFYVTTIDSGTLHVYKA